MGERAASAPRPGRRCRGRAALRAPDRGLAADGAEAAGRPGGGSGGAAGAGSRAAAHPAAAAEACGRRGAFGTLAGGARSAPPLSLSSGSRRAGNGSPHRTRSAAVAAAPAWRRLGRGSGGGAVRRAERSAIEGPHRSSLGACWRRMGAAAAALEAEHEVADVDLVALADDRRLGDLPTVDVRAVGALQVGDDEAAVAEQQPGVVLRDVPLREHEIVALDAADVDLVLVERLLALCAALFADDDREHSSFLRQ